MIFSVLCDNMNFFINFLKVEYSIFIDKINIMCVTYNGENRFLMIIILM